MAVMGNQCRARPTGGQRYVFRASCSSGISSVMPRRSEAGVGDVGESFSGALQKTSEHRFHRKQRPTTVGLFNFDRHVAGILPCTLPRCGWLCRTTSCTTFRLADSRGCNWQFLTFSGSFGRADRRWLPRLYRGHIVI